MMKSIQLLSLGLLLFVTVPLSCLQAQCKLSPLPSSSYQVGTCGGKTFQSITGSLLSISGSCGGCSIDRAELTTTSIRAR